MRNSILIFVMSVVLGLGGGYGFYQLKNSDEAEAAPKTEQAAKHEGHEEGATTETTAPAAVAAEGEIFQQKGCLSCHSISKLDLQGGVTGPDLSQAYTNVEGKHGKPIQEFLKQPTSAVMSSVIGGSPLTDEEIEKIVSALKLASEK